MIPLTMRMNGDQDGRAGKWVVVLSSVVAPARPDTVNITIKLRLLALPTAQVSTAISNQ